MQTVYHQSLLPRVLRQHKPYLFWLNLNSKAEVHELFAQWKAGSAKIVSEPEDKPWKLREFMAADLDGNLIGDNRRFPPTYYTGRGSMNRQSEGDVALGEVGAHCSGGFSPAAVPSAGVDFR